MTRNTEIQENSPEESPQLTIKELQEKVLQLQEENWILSRKYIEKEPPAIIHKPESTLFNFDPSSIPDSPLEKSKFLKCLRRSINTLVELQEDLQTEDNINQVQETSKALEKLF